MNHAGGWALTLAASSSPSKSSGSSSSFLLILVVGFGLVWWFVLRPQQQKARKAREVGRTFEVGDEVVTIGGIVGRVLEVEGDRVTILSGGEDGIGGGIPTRLVLVRQGIARRVEPPDPAAEEEADEASDRPELEPGADGAASANGVLPDAADPEEHEDDAPDGPPGGGGDTGRGRRGDRGRDAQ